MSKVDAKRCKGCKMMRPIEEFDFKQTADGRRRRKETCRSCLSRRIHQLKRQSPFAPLRFSDEASAALAGAIRSWFSGSKGT